MLIHWLERHAQNNKLTKGTLYTDSGRELQTLERPWLNNLPFVSCIPNGAYKISPWASPAHGPCYILEGEGVGHTSGKRTHILFHVANYVHQLEGCIALGLKWRGDTLLNSKAAVELFMQDMAGREAMLFISTHNKDEV